MARLKKKYSNGQSRGSGTEPQKHSTTPKNYHHQEIAFHGSEAAYERWKEDGKRGYL